MSLRQTSSNSKFPAKTHARKVADELGVDNGLIYLPGQLESTWEDSDMGPSFRQRRYFYYLTGADFAGCAVTYDMNLLLWFGTTPTPAKCLEKADLDEVKYVSDLPKYLISKLATVQQLYVLRESQMPKLGSLGVLTPQVRVDTTSLLPAISEARVVKTDYEIAMIRIACAVSSKAHHDVCARFLYFKNECEIEATFSASCIASNSHAQSYPVIAGSGTNAGTLHYDSNNEPLEGRQVVVLDAGAERNCYASDITRTLPIGGKFTREGKASTTFLQLHAHMVAANGLLHLGILHNGSAREIFANGTTAAFFPHVLGHHVGLEVHDVPGREKLMLQADGLPSVVRRSKRTPITPGILQAMIKDAAGVYGGPFTGRRELDAGMVVTIEPGIYFCREYIEASFLKKPEHAKYINREVLEKYWGVGGVRIEDCILVTGEGHENISSAAPKGERMLNIINRR
ncbi:peptidase M24, structural domain-containing protein [Pseudomassariella vexata]|uniref:Xaa-Pro aminopeptidase n=1 Tax=Pseudomassariella vexata TaxID=1141098 RepID=A0A1Y2EEP4_9PEZI|nr:peptidase M24, structural domain-containing protein [Pseudomassariella vexata]ORY70048.1 peptidase M24, structural domain-containing protein [Pseudomassariella vexata]